MWCKKMLKHKNIFFISIILMLLFVTASGVSAADGNATDELDTYEINDDSNIELESNDENFNNELESNNIFMTFGV